MSSSFTPTGKFRDIFVSLFITLSSVHNNNNSKKLEMVVSGHTMKSPTSDLVSSFHHYIFLPLNLIESIPSNRSVKTYNETMTSSVEDKGCVNNLTGNDNIQIHKTHGPNRTPNHRASMGKKPTPSKWDDAQKWIVNFSKVGDKKQPRNSNADDRRLIAPVPKKEGYSSGEEEQRVVVVEEDNGFSNSVSYGIETKNVDCDEESIWRINKPSSQSSAPPVVRSICVRDMGTEMTPIASQEPSRTATPIRASTPVGRSPISSASSTPARTREAPEGVGSWKEDVKKVSSVERRAMAWDEAERAKYMARYKRDEVKIQAWENHEMRKAEMELKKMEAKVERLKARAEEKVCNKIASTRRIADEKRENAEARLNENSVKTAERADYIRRTGNLPSSFKIPSFCW